jgi:putative heme-binding domain-containing protein
MVLPVAALAQDTSSLGLGRALFRSNCAFCHGMTAGGGRGPNLASGQLSHGNSDAAIKRVVRLGVPGTTMPSFTDLGDDDLTQLLEYLRSLQHQNSSSQQNLPGDAAKGMQTYAKSGCAGCHRIGEQGSVFGPDLSRIGASRSVEYIRESILKPSADIPEAFEGVTAVLKDGKRVRGVRVNEDTFSLQLRDSAQKIRMYQKSELREVIYEKNSLMPAYDSLSKDDLENLVAYLAGLRGAVDDTAVVKKQGGIR